MNPSKQINNEQDEYIKKAFKKDLFINELIFTDYASELQYSKLKVKKFTSFQRIIIPLILLSLITVTALCVYFALPDNSQKQPSFSTANTINENTYVENKIENVTNIESNQIENTSIKNENKITNKLSNKVTNKTNTNTNSNTNTASQNTNKVKTNTSSSTNEITGVNITKNNDKDFSEIDIEEVTNFINICSVGIERISFDSENLESNTILLLIAKEFFDTNSNKSSLEINSNYAPTAKNMHKFLTEFTGKDYTKTEYIRAFNNYIAYTSTSKSYTYGRDASIITDEEYTASNVEITNEFNDIYTATANVTRKVNDEKTNYEVTFTFSINEDFKYQKYCLKSLNVKNLSFYPDNTIHLVDIDPESEEN